jgi:hypothetical protein
MKHFERDLVSHCQIEWIDPSHAYVFSAQSGARNESKEESLRSAGLTGNDKNVISTNVVRRNPVLELDSP